MSAFNHAPWHHETDQRGNVLVYATRTGPDDKHIIGVSQFGPIEQRQANARLIAAAPDGYDAGSEAVEALTAMMDAWFDYHDANSLTQPVTSRAGSAFDKALAAREKLEAFLAKARGQ